MSLERHLAVILVAAALVAGLGIAHAQTDGVSGGAEPGQGTTAPNPFLRRTLREGFFNANGRIIPRRITSDCTSRAFSTYGC